MALPVYNKYAIQVYINSVSINQYRDVLSKYHLRQRKFPLVCKKKINHNPFIQYLHCSNFIITRIALIKNL